MKEQLAERLLARVMNWRPEDVARERPILQAMAAYKYDEYQQYSPGLRFIESLALWLNSIKDPAQKAEAYAFVRNRLVFFSTAEMHHLVAIAYPDFIRPRLIQRVAKENGLNPYHVGRVLASPAFKRRERATLFLGLSDGARTDVFRRAHEEFIDHEQVLQNYEIKSERSTKLLEELHKSLKRLTPGDASVDTAKFGTLVLLDDFSASGTSYIRPKEGRWKGKLQELAEGIITPNSETSKLLDCEKPHVLVVLYVATQQAVDHIRDALGKVWKGHAIDFDIIPVHPLDEAIRIKSGDALSPLLDAHYVHERMVDVHTSEGGKSIKYGYADCGLPVVLAHNSPNNSIYPLWNTESDMRALFPRIKRHKPT